MGRRWGKTIAAGTSGAVAARAGEPVAWIVPTYKNARPVWRFLEQHCRPLHKRILEIHRADRVIEFSNGGFIAVYSADNDTSIRGERFGRVRIDEASRITESTYTDVIEPTVADLNGEIWNISTPSGKNWFWRGCMRAQAEQQEKGSKSFEAFWRATSFANPNRNIQNAYLMAKERLPIKSFAQEWDAEFVDDSGGVFQHVSELQTAIRQFQRMPTHTYVMGIDWGKQLDYTVVSVIDVTIMEQCYMERFNGVSYGFQMERIKNILQLFRPLITVPERNSMGEPLVEVVRTLPYAGNVLPFYATNISKARMIETLALAFEHRTLKLLPHQDQALELEAFETHRTPSGLITYAAPDDMHDDTVIALGIGWQAVADAMGYSMPTIYAGEQRTVSINTNDRQLAVSR